jgi:hypothetical protein
MPVLREYVDHEGFYVVTGIKGNAVTYQVSAGGAEKLREAGIKPGDKFSRFMLLDLYRAGDVFTGHSGPGEVLPSVPPGQGELDFTNDPEPESTIPTCSRCTSPYDLHVVEVKGEVSSATILCLQCRSKTTGLDTSIPLPLVSRKILSRFVALKGIARKDPSVLAFQALLDQDFSTRWENIRRKKPIQESLMPETDPQGSLL